MLAALVLQPLSTPPTTAAPIPTATCRDIKAAYQGSSCCGASLDQMTDYFVSPPPPPLMPLGPNICAGTKPYYANTTGFPDTPQAYFYNTNCTLEGGIANALEQAGANVTVGYVGQHPSPSGATPITTPYFEAGLCPVNVHWHLGAEHLSEGQFDYSGTGPAYSTRVRGGLQCHHYDAMDPQYTTPYDWQYCRDMQVGQTYEIHWPHSAAGACGTPWQYQFPFYDGVFCRPGIITLNPVNTFTTIGVQSQVFTIVNNESYYYPNLVMGMIMDGEFGADIAKYTGSTTGTTRNNEICSRYTPITWQVDRKCHLISASSFDKMCKDMLEMADDMSGDVFPHGSRPVSADHLVAPNLVRRE